jgi:hypothetical protein
MQEDRTVPAKWTEVENVPIQFTNQMLIQHVQNEFILTFGYATPPALLNPTQEEMEAIEFIPVMPIVRLGMTPQRLLELINVLQTNYRTYEAGQAMEENR